MPKNVILCATDLTDASTRPVDLAIATAKAFKGSVELLHIFDNTDQMLPEAADVEEARSKAIASVGEHERSLREKLDAERDRCQAAGVKCTTVFEVAKPWRRIPEVAKERDARMIVIGGHGGKGAVVVDHEGWSERVLGTTADRVLRTTDRPVLVSTGEAPVAYTLKDTRWFVGCDFSPAADEALSMIAALVKELGGELHVGNVVIPAGGEEKSDDERNWRQILREQSKKEAEAKLVEHVEKLSKNAIVHQIVSPEGAAHALCEAASFVEADFLVVGAHGQTALGRLLVGSTAEHCLRSATVPVLLVPDPAAYRESLFW